jgi:hypothetical protein
MNNNLIELADNANFISGIHNYCDRWCERCPFTSRCILYVQLQDVPDVDQNGHIASEKLWLKLAAIFKEAREMITAWAAENKVDLSPEALEEAGAENERLMRKARKHPLAKAAEGYAYAVETWFSQRPLLMETTSDNEAGSEELAREEDDFNEALEVIRWYQFFIAAKLIRGLYSRQDEEELEEGPKDSEGSAKIALIAIDRSFGAWRLLQLQRPELSSCSMPFLVKLERMRLQAEEEFPFARDFIRPGFDEQALGAVN